MGTVRSTHVVAWTRAGVVGALGALAGAFVGMDLWARGASGPPEPGALAARLAVGAALGAASLVALRFVARTLVGRLSPGALLPDSPYQRLEVASYSPFLLPLAGVAGVHVSIPVAYAMLLAFAAGQVALVLRARPRAHHVATADTHLALLFALSGMAALVYEIVWQRVLFAAYGVNIESVTLVVAVFMLGLGLGALVGARVSERFPKRLPELFAGAELAIGVFGAVSIPLIEAIAARTLHLSMAGVAAAVFGSLLLPTLLMGATLPVLVAHVTRHDAHVGATVGRLYGLNTLGAALASLLTVDVLFVMLGRQAVVWVAVLLNCAVAVLVLRIAARVRALRGTERQREAELTDEREKSPRPARSLPPAWVLVVAALVGFVSLSQEILWVRVIGFAMLGIPQVFGHVLGVFLIGVALGARDAKALCGLPGADVVRALARRLLVAGVAAYVAIPLVGQVMSWSKSAGLPVAYLAVGAGAYLLGAVLPVLSHVAAARGAAAGVSVAWIYVANVAGCTAGPLVTAFVLFDHFTLEQCSLGLSLATLAGAGTLSITAARPGRDPARAAVLYAAAVLALAIPLVHDRLYAELFEKLLYGASFESRKPFRRVVQNRSGVLAVEAHPAGDVIYGGGNYDGRFTIDPVTGANAIERAYMLASLHRKPRRVLVIGLSSGSWVRVVASHRSVEQITVVELNPGYSRLIREYAGQAGILDDSRIEYAWDDGRRWLRRNPDERFDFILMNTVQHYRSNATNLLSREFLELCRSHLEPGGVIYYNTTGSPDAAYTAATAFRYVVRFSNFVAASASPIDLTRDERRKNLELFLEGGRRLLNAETTERLASSSLHDRGEELRASADLQTITDDNMLTEFKRAHTDLLIPRLYGWHDPSRAWGRVMAR